MEISGIFLAPGAYMWIMIVTHLAPRLGNESVTLQMAFVIAMSLGFWTWVYRVTAIILCKIFGLNGTRRHG